MRSDVYTPLDKHRQGIYDDILYHGSVSGLGTGAEEVQPNLIEERPILNLVNLIQDDGWDSCCVAEPDVLQHVPSLGRKAKVRPGQLAVLSTLKHEAAANKRRLVSQMYASHSCSYSSHSFLFPFAIPAHAAVLHVPPPPHMQAVAVVANCCC